MKKLGTVIVLLLLSVHAISQRFDLTEESKQLIGTYDYCATFDDQWEMIDDSDSLTHEIYLFESCDDSTIAKISLTITKISRKKKRWLDKQPKYAFSYKYIYDNIKMIVGCEGHYGRHYPLSGTNKNIGRIDVGLQRNVEFKDENLGINGHFIYFGFEINDKLYWYKFRKQ